MKSSAVNLEVRIKTLGSVLSKVKDRQAVEAAVNVAKGDWSVARDKLKKDKLPDAMLKKLDWAHTLAEWSGDHVPVVKKLFVDVNGLPEVALNYNVEKLATLVDDKQLPEDAVGETVAEKKKNFASKLVGKLFTEGHASPVLRRMVMDAEIPIPDLAIRTGVADFLGNQPEFNIRTTSIYTALKHPEAFKGIAEGNRDAVVVQLKKLTLASSISPVPEAVPVLMRANLGAFHVAEMPESAFLKKFGKALGAKTARQIHANATNSRIRNEHALMVMRESQRGTGLAIIDGDQSREARSFKMRSTARKQALPLNLENLFGSIDSCECGECNSVYSPAAYYVELLQFLRNNNLDPEYSNTGAKGISGTLLEKLFRRRPDLGCLELTCENTNTVLPYIDLANEVMESFVVHLNEYSNDPNTPKQARLEVFNVGNETSGELLAQPQHTNYDAYCTLKNAVYPFTLPYHQLIDDSRIFLNHLGIRRDELLDTFRAASDGCDYSSWPADQQQELRELHGNALDRSVDAEFLGLTQEEFIILTKSAFWQKRYFDLSLKTEHSEETCRQKIGVKPVHEYFGYDTEEEMLSTDAGADGISGKGLTLVKRQFLPRTGIQYVDLVDLLKTRFINPAFPQGQALTMLESIRFSYRFLQTLVDTSSSDPKTRFAKLIDFLEVKQPLLVLLDSLLHPDPCHPNKIEAAVAKQDLREWVYCRFEQIGKLIVLESGEGPRLLIAGQIIDEKNQMQLGTLHTDGSITDENGQLIGNVRINGKVVGTDGNLFWQSSGWLQVIDGSGETVGHIGKNGVLVGQGRELPIRWKPAQETCDLRKVRLTHLDGTTVMVEEYDRMQRFIRLWRKLGWSVDETDKALVGLSSNLSAGSGGCDCAGFGAFEDDCTDGHCDEGDCCEATPECGDITPELLHQLAAVRKLLDRTGLPLPKLLAFWADISTSGEKSLYAQLFLTHNLLGMDDVFRADANGNYLTQSAKISEHVPVLMAALKLRDEDITSIMTMCAMSDELTLANVSVLYRYGLICKVLHIKTAELPKLNALFGEPFKDAQATLKLFETWGKMEDAGFTLPQLSYLICNLDDARHPLAPTQKNVLQLAKTLYDGLNAIDRDHADVPTDHSELATSELVRAKAGLLFDAQRVERIVGLLEGTTVYSTNAPVNQALAIPDALSKKFRYTNQANANPPQASIQLTGILTGPELALVKTLSIHPNWEVAVDRLGKQASKLFDEALFGIFSDIAEAKARLLAGDISVPLDQQDATQPDPSTAPAKRNYFLSYFLPFLRERLTHRFVVDSMAGVSGLPQQTSDVLLAEVLKVSGKPAMDVLKEIKSRPDDNSSGWNGYLIAPVEDQYTFVAIGDSQPAPLLLDGQVVTFPQRQEDPDNIWFSDPQPLTGNKLYRLEVTAQTNTALQWKTVTSSGISAIPASALLPDYSRQDTQTVLVSLCKAAMLVNAFRLTRDEVVHLQTHPSDFETFDFNAIKLQHWLRLHSYATLRDALPQSESMLIKLFQWAGDTAAEADKLTEQISAVTQWDKGRIEQLVSVSHFDLSRPSDFCNEVNLVKMQRALQAENRTGADIDALFAWAKPGSKFIECQLIAEDIRRTVRARYDQEDWEQVVKPLNDQLRGNQRQALIDYLLVQPALIEWGVVDADSLFEFFLIDVQMGACMETSRIKQAISTVQLFVQRCLLGLESRDGISNQDVDRERWEWMQKYRVWEANRKVYLYPENWIKPELRDDKSPFYKELESELLQKDISKQTVEDALKSYLYKVDEVANLKVVGLFLDETGSKLHIFARTRNAPYFFFYRYYSTSEKNWYPWEKMQVDIPSYDVEDSSGKITDNGTYLIPVVWNNRLIVFFPQMIKKTSIPSAGGSIKTAKKDKEDEIHIPSFPTSFWEIKLAWSEYRNGKWMQKQLSKDALTVTATCPISQFFFVPFIERTPPNLDTDHVSVRVYAKRGDVSGEFYFTGSQLFSKSRLLPSAPLPVPDDFHFSGNRISSYQFPRPANLSLSTPYFIEALLTNEHEFLAYTENESESSRLRFCHDFSHNLVGQISVDGISGLLGYFTKEISSPSNRWNEAFGYISTAESNELKQPYSLYNWEAAFHAPMLLADRLLQSQQFEQALKMCHYIFNPMAEGVDAKRCWQFPPFKEIDADSVLKRLFNGLGPRQSDSDINEWRNKPFQPHVVARSRPSAYMKWVVMKYIEILIACGDHYFRQNTLETIPMAVQCYVLAAHIYGPRGQKIPKRGKIAAQSYNSLLDKWDAFGNAMVEMDLAFPYSNQSTLPIGFGKNTVGTANIFGFASTLYFCIPDNPQLRALRDTIDDRLFKLRHCLDINGVFRKLPLFEPPIDPALLVQAAAQGVSLSSVLNDLNSPMPNYRFYYLLQKALELCGELKSLGNAFLSAKEKRDAEALSQLRAKHESAMHHLVMEVRKQQLEESAKSLDALQQNRKGAESRMQYYLKLIGEDLGKVPGNDTDFSELQNSIEQPVDVDGLKLTKGEKEEIDKADSAADLQLKAGITEALASILYAIPVISTDAKPMGVGAGVEFGGVNLGQLTQAITKGMQIAAGHHQHQSSSAARKGGFQRQMQDRVQQANSAGYEIKNIDKQILTQQIRINITQQEITNQQKQIDNAQEVEEYLRSKYSNEELYSWMEGNIRTLYYQAYTLAYELAKKVEKTYCFERSLASSNFIQFGYWDASRDGLLSGEKLYLGLKQLESAYQEKRGHDYEISRSISLRQLDPLALLKLREKGMCEFTLPEVLFDMDHPGHYMRRVKSVALSIPCVVGPYTSLNCTLRLLEHKFRINAIANNKADYPEKMGEADERFATVNVPISSIAVSSGQNDSGVFELNFRDERYIPFEGAGAISKWRVELPESFRQFDYDTISDVIMHLRYTASDGGDKLKKPAEGSVQDFIKGVALDGQQEGLFAVFDIRRDFSNEWHKAMQSRDGATERIIELNKLYDYLPIFTKGHQPAGIIAKEIVLLTSASVKKEKLQVKRSADGNDFSISDGEHVGKEVSCFVSKDIECQLDNWQIRILDMGVMPEKLWMVVKYELAGVNA